jgi:hypothetical protein
MARPAPSVGFRIAAVGWRAGGEGVDAFGYDFVMILWGVVFILAATCFILAMNRVFSTEERRQEALARAAGLPQPPSDH